MGGGDFEKIVRTGLCNKKKSRTDHKKKKARVQPAEAEKGKDKKIERARELKNKTNYNMKYMYHVILGRF